MAKTTSSIKTSKTKAKPRAKTKPKAKRRTKEEIALIKQEEAEMAELDKINSYDHMRENLVGSSKLIERKIQFYKVLKKQLGNITAAARELGINPDCHDYYMQNDDYYVLKVDQIYQRDKIDYVEGVTFAGIRDKKERRALRRNGEVIVDEKGQPIFEEVTIRKGDTKVGIDILKNIASQRGYNNIQKNVNINANFDMDKRRKALDLAKDISEEEINLLSDMISKRTINLDPD